ncbi:MAG TPA: hypothetical protein VFQ63_01610 [Patescibacteria group bacterium]|nr:hypothetical protein [Patescibacteria group bacterium]
MPETPQDRIHVVRLGDDPAPSPADQSLAVARLDVAVPPPPAGFGDSSTGLLVPVSSTGLLRGVPLRPGEEVQGGLVIPPKETSQVTNEAVLAGLAAEKQHDQFRVSASEINFDTSGAILVKYLRQAIERRKYEKDLFREIILEDLPEEPDNVVYSVASFKRKSRQVASPGEMREVTSPGSTEEVMIAAMDVVHALISPPASESSGQQESPRDRQKAAVKVMKRMHAMLKTGAIQLQGSGDTLAEMPDFTQACIDVLKASDMIQFPDARKLIYDMVEYVALPDSQKPKYLELLDYYADLDHPLAFALTIDESIHHPDSEWVLLQKDRIKKLVEVLKGSPQDLFDNFDRLRDLAKGIVLIGPPLLDITGKVGWEIEFKAQRQIAAQKEQAFIMKGLLWN